MEWLARINLFELLCILHIEKWYKRWKIKGLWVSLKEIYADLSIFLLPIVRKICRKILSSPIRPYIPIKWWGILCSFRSRRSLILCFIQSKACNQGLYSKIDYPTFPTIDPSPIMRRKILEDLNLFIWGLGSIFSEI